MKPVCLMLLLAASLWSLGTAQSPNSLGGAATTRACHAEPTAEHRSVNPTDYDLSIDGRHLEACAAYLISFYPAQEESFPDRALEWYLNDLRHEMDAVGMRPLLLTAADALFDISEAELTGFTIFGSQSGVVLLPLISVDRLEGGIEVTLLVYPFKREHPGPATIGIGTAFSMLDGTLANNDDLKEHRPECVSYVWSRADIKFYDITLREDHEGPSCDGDPIAAPVIGRFRVNKFTGELLRYDPSTSSYRVYPPQSGGGAEPRSLTVTPQVQVSVAEPLSLVVVPGISISETVAVPIPTVTVAVMEPEPEPIAGAAEGEVLAASKAASAGEPAEGSMEPPGTPVMLAQQPYRETRERPLAVMLDNTDIGYPQAGLLQASAIYELPVEGGLTRLMTVYDHIDPNRVGPIRATRDYFVELARSMNSILVHDGGSPSAMALIGRGSTPTFNADTEGALFIRSENQPAPYNLYTTGSDMRREVNRLNLGLTRTVSGEVFRPAEGAPAATQIAVQYSGTYSSGFRYLPDVNLYRWQRNGEAATDASGEAVLADAVVVANITARQIPNDPAGRLYIPLSGGEATLYLNGKAIPGHWTPQSGLSFLTNSGDVVDLMPFKHWVLFAPDWASVSTR